MAGASAAVDLDDLSDRLAGLPPSPTFAIGHFSMSENPPLFLSYLEPVLAEIAERE